LLNFKKCTLKDLYILKEISIQTFVQTYGEYNTQKDMDLYIYNSLSDEALTKQITDSYSLFYLAFNEETLIGYIKLNYGKAQSKTYKEKSIEIERIYVLNQFQLNGYGHQLLQKAVAVARELKKDSIWLAVWEENNNAIEFYKKYHFEQITTISFILGESPFTGLVLQKKIDDISTILKQNNADYELVHQDKPIRSATDASGYYDVSKSAPTILLETDKGLIAYIKSVNSENIDFSFLKQALNCKQLKMANPKVIKELLGYEIGSIPLVGLELTTIFDNTLLNFDYVYGGTGDLYTTLKIAPEDIKKINSIELTVN